MNEKKYEIASDFMEPLFSVFIRFNYICFVPKSKLQFAFQSYLIEKLDT